MNYKEHLIEDGWTKKFSVYFTTNFLWRWCIMARDSTGKYALAISGTGAFVHISEFEPKHPQLDPRNPGADGVALMNARPQNFTILSGGGGRATVDLTLPGDFAFNSNGMQPLDGSAENRNREAVINLGYVTIEIS
jgi:hypothetical protein